MPAKRISKVRAKRRPTRAKPAGATARSTPKRKALAKRPAPKPQAFTVEARPAKPLEIRPITIGGFELRETGVKIIGRPSFLEFDGALAFANRSQKAAGWWVADLLRYGETREDWRQRLEQVVDATHYSEKTVKNLKYVGENVHASRRRGDVDISLHSLVAPLTPAEQVAWLARAADERLTYQELRTEIRASRRRRVIEGQAKLEGMYRVIYADPPWLYGDKPPSGSGAQTHYEGMPIEDLCKLPVEAHAMPESVLWMWIPAPMILEHPGPREVIEAWGFQPKTGRVWDKVQHGFGHYVEVRHEHLIIATRGSCTPDRLVPMLPSVVVERRSDVHSEKPDSFRRDIERLYDGPYLELFGRKSVAGWSVFGNDAALWAQEAATA